MPGGSRQFEFDSIAYQYALAKDIPILGICMGMQLMCNVDNSSENYRDVPIKNDSYINHCQIGVLEAHYIDIDSIVVMSDTILNDLIDYISNEMIQSLNTTGVIIKKEGADFIVYHVSINNNQFIIVPKVSTGEEIKDKYLKNPLNGNIKGLDEFLEINPRR